MANYTSRKQRGVFKPKPKTRKQQTQDHETSGVTMHGLHRWYQRAFEELGFMILAKDKNQKDAIVHYKASIDRLVAALKTKSRELTHPDKKTDVGIMLHNVALLQDHVAKDFP
jgi:hypothetical protein